MKSASSFELFPTFFRERNSFNENGGGGAISSGRGDGGAISSGRGVIAQSQMVGIAVVAQSQMAGMAVA